MSLHRIFIPTIYPLYRRLKRFVRRCIAEICAITTPFALSLGKKVSQAKSVDILQIHPKWHSLIRDEEVKGEEVSSPPHTYHVDVPNDELTKLIPSGPGGMKSVSESLAILFGCVAKQLICEENAQWKSSLESAGLLQSSELRQRLH